MRTPLAWNNVVHNKVRTAASLSGVTFAILLVFMQLGFYDVCFRSSTMIYDQLDFDLALLSNATGQSVQHRACMARGDTKCCFRFTDDTTQ